MRNSKLYLSHVKDHNLAKNSFQAAVLKMIGDYDRVLVESPAIFAKRLQFRLNEMHKSFPRCGAIKVDCYPAPGRAESGIHDTRCVIGEYIFLDFLEVKGRVVDGVVQPFLDFEKGGVGCS